MFPYVYDTLNPKHFHYQLEQNVTQEFTNYYVVPDEWLEEANKRKPVYSSILMDSLMMKIQELLV